MRVTSKGGHVKLLRRPIQHFYLLEVHCSHLRYHPRLTVSPLLMETYKNQIVKNMPYMMLLTNDLSAEQLHKLATGSLGA